MPINAELTESIRLCKQYRQYLLENSTIPANHFQGQTASMLSQSRRQQLSKLEGVIRELSVLAASDSGLLL